MTPLTALPAVLADSDAGKGSPIGLLVVLLLIVAVYFLYRSMNRHLRKVPSRFDQQQRLAPDVQPRTESSPAESSSAESSSAESEPAEPERPEQDG